jgi:phosphotransacetylase
VTFLGWAPSTLRKPPICKSYFQTVTYRRIPISAEEYEKVLRSLSLVIYNPWRIVITIVRQQKKGKSMEAEKLAIIKQMEEKGLTPQQVGESIDFNPEVLALYLVKDAYPVPARILNKVSEFLSK